MATQSNQRIDGSRLWDLLMAMAQIGATSKRGVRWRTGKNAGISCDGGAGGGRQIYRRGR
jgi:hypothetical protein